VCSCPVHTTKGFIHIIMQIFLGLISILAATTTTTTSSSPSGTTESGGSTATEEITTTSEEQQTTSMNEDNSTAEASTSFGVFSKELSGVILVAMAVNGLM
jgi:hypothetical protein